MGRLHYRNRLLSHIISCISLDGESQYFLRLSMSGFPCLSLDPADQLGRVELRLFLHGAYEHGLGFFAGHPCELFEFLSLACDQFIVLKML